MLNKNRLTAYFIITSIVILMTSKNANAQWSSYSNTGWFSQPFFSSPFFSFNPMSNYGGSFNNSFYPPYGSSSSSGLYNFQGLLYENQYGGIYPGLTSYNNFADWTGYTPFSAVPNFSSTFNPYIGLLSPGSWSTSYPLQNGPLFPPPYYSSVPTVVNVTANTGWTGIIPVPRSESEPRDAPRKLNGKWQSEKSTEEGNLKIDHGSNKMLAMEGASLPLDEGHLTEFKYTPKKGNSPISFKATFDSDHTAGFTGTANNNLPCEGCMFGWYSRDVYNFKVKGEYVVKDDFGNVADKGTFSLIGY